VEAQARRLTVLRAADIAQLVFRRSLEPFDARCVEVRWHHEHSSMELLQTRGVPSVDSLAQRRCLRSFSAIRAFTSFFKSAAGNGLSTGNWIVPLEMV
jgi:hypothetical protein